MQGAPGTRPMQGRLRDSVRKEWFADSQFFSAQGHQARAAADLRDRARLIRADRASSAAVRIRPALRALVVIRHAPEWAV